MKNSVYLQLALIAGSLILLVFLVVNQQPPMETPTAIVLRDGDQEIEVVPSSDDSGDAPDGVADPAPAEPGASTVSAGSSSASAPAPRPRKRAPKPDVEAPSEPPAAAAEPQAPTEPGVAAAMPDSETSVETTNAMRASMGLPPLTAPPAAETKF